MVRRCINVTVRVSDFASGFMVVGVIFSLRVGVAGFRVGRMTANADFVFAAVIVIFVVSILFFGGAMSRRVVVVTFGRVGIIAGSTSVAVFVAS